MRSCLRVVDAGQRWVEGLRLGDPDVFDEVYEAFRPRIFGYLLRLTKDRPLAEDLLQDTWLKAARAARRLAPDSRLEPWLFRIAHNTFVSQRRWAKVDLLGRTELRARPEEPAPPTPFDNHARSELSRRLEGAMAGLKIAHREVLILVAVEGLAPAQAAEVVGVSPAALRKRLERARTELAEALTEEERARIGRAPQPAST